LSPRSASDSTVIPQNDPEKCDVAYDNGSLVASPGFKFEKVPIDLLEVGDVVRVQNGATPPSDGTIVSGVETSFDESALTGEARLIKKNIGDKVLLGTINKSRAVDARVDAIGGVTLLVPQLRFSKYCLSDLVLKVGSDRADCPRGPNS
jgi:cation transport ATPase